MFVTTSAPKADDQPSTRAASRPAVVAAQADTDHVLRFLEDRVRRDPDDITALNRLAGIYLLRARETGNVDYILLAKQKVAQSMTAVPADVNLGALLAQSRVQFESHEFAEARDSARKLTDLAADKPTSFAALGDALLELGDYDAAAAAYDQMRALDDSGVGTLTRLGRLALLHGDVPAARDHLAAALAEAEARKESPESIAWCHWQLGEVDFSRGDYPAAERSYRAALDAFPGYFRALASLGRARAAQDDLAGAIKEYEHATAIVPDPTFVAALADLYHLAGRDREAHQQYALVEQIAKLTAFRGSLYNRQLALYRADHDLKPDEAYADATREYAVRKDVYGADAVAWAALKAGHLPEAQTAIHDALRLGTRDARLFYHAGLIARAAGDRPAALAFLTRATETCAKFDPLQSVACAKALSELRGVASH